MSSIESLENEIRERLIEFGQSKFGKQKWYEICAALDNIGDTALALKSYRNSGLGKTFTSQYLRLFGVLQSICIQQDSIHTLWNDTIGFWNTPSTNSGWSKIRRLRNVIGGHPAQKGGAVARVTIKTQKLLVTHSEKTKNRTVYETLDLRSLVEDYTREAEEILSSLYQKLVSDIAGRNLSQISNDSKSRKKSSPLIPPVMPDDNPTAL